MHEQFKQPASKEVNILNNQENLLKLARKLETVYQERPNIQSFVGSMQNTRFEKDYTKEAIEKDELYVIETRDRIDASNSSFGKEQLDHFEGGFQLSEMLQAMAVDCINKYWFKDCKSIMTSDYDDLRVGIDAVMKNKKGGYLGLAFDFTITNQEKTIYHKLQNIWDRNTKDGKIPTIKYFEDPDTKQKGNLLVPKFIIGASKIDVEEFATAYLIDDISTLENHPFKYLMLLQIEEQLQTVLDYYEVNNENTSLSFAKTQYERIQNILRNMKNDIHVNEKMHENIDIYEYTKSSIALDTMRRFRITKDHKPKMEE